MRANHYICQLAGIIKLSFYTQRICLATDIEVTPGNVLIFSPDNGTDRFDTQVVCFQFIGVTVYLDLMLRCTTDRYCTHTGNTCQGIHHAVVQNFIKCRLALFRLDGKQYDRNHIRTELEDNRILDIVGKL